MTNVGLAFLTALLQTAAGTLLASAWPSAWSTCS
jgi:hypothetical protein